MIFEAEAGDATDRLQSAIDRASAAGARLTLGAGLHQTRGLTLRSGTDLHLAEGAILKPIGDYEAYAETRVDLIAEASNRAMLVAQDAEQISISGAGTIEAPGAAFIAGDLPEMGTHSPARFRPRVLVLDRCRGIRLSGITVRQSPMWTLHLAACSDVVISGLSIAKDRRMPNTDGIVIDSCSDVEIRDVAIATADDGIVLKTSRRPDGAPIGPCRNVQVRNCRIESRSCALKLGTESHADLADISFSDCIVTRSNRALGLFSRDGGAMARIAFRRIQVECEETPDGFWGSGEAITVNVLDRVTERPAGAVRDLLFEDIFGVMEGAVNLIAERPDRIAGVMLRRVHLAQRAGVLGTGRRYDLRPTRADLALPPGAEGRANAYVKDASGRVAGLEPYPGGMPALYARNVTGLGLDDVRFDRPFPLPADCSTQEINLV
jgi:polygalacturonase